MSQPTSSRAGTPTSSQPRFNASQAAAFLRATFQDELDAAARTTDGSCETYKSATVGVKTPWSGSWGAPKGGLMSDGKDFMTVLSSAYDLQLKTQGSAAASPVLGGGGGAGGAGGAGGKVQNK